VPALAEAPPGWYRDELGRVYQVTFDLLDRFYLGAGWLPLYRLSSSEHDLARVRMEMGFSASLLDIPDRARRTFEAVKGEVAMGDLELRGTLFGYEYSHSSIHPLWRITTFFGKPRRFDSYPDMGWGMQLLSVQVHPHQQDDLVDLQYGELHLAWDLWQSHDLYSHLRWQLGGGMGLLTGGPFENHYALPEVALVGRFGLDRDGFHTLNFKARASMPLFLSGEFQGTLRQRDSVEVAYEVIVLAVNDQPITLRVAGSLDRRNDLPEGANELEAMAMAGLRFSFWAPPRSREVLPDVRRP
jgi:hypothetical protein